MLVRTSSSSKAGPVFRLTYCSSACLSPHRTAQKLTVGRILSSARFNNARQHITGALFFSGQCFVQHLEGPQEYVEATLDRIAQDVRHTNLNVVSHGWGENRRFASWSMIYVDAETTPASRTAAGLMRNAPDIPAGSDPQLEALLQDLVADYLSGP